MKIAVITGASSGMGREFCRQLDDRGFDEIWGLGLGEENFKALAAELKTPLRYFDKDLTKLENIEFFKSELEKHKPQVEWLVNASGFGKFGRYDEIEVETKVNMVELNCVALMRMTEYVLPYMSEGGRIIEIASVAAFQPIPCVNVYAATKAFVVSYSRAMNVELKSRKISVTCLCPYWTKTAFFDRAKKINSKTGVEVVTKYVVMYDPIMIVRKAIKAADKRKEMCIPGFIARSQVRLVKLLPHKIVMKIWCRQQKLKQKYKDR